MSTLLTDRFMTPVETPRLILRKLTMADAQDLYAYSCDPEVARFVLWSAHRSISDTRFFLRCLIRQYRAGEYASYGIELKKTGRIIGTIGFSVVSREHRCVEIGYSLSRRHWNCGYMSEALSAMIKRGFEEEHFHRIEATHDVRNGASGRVMEKCGMQKEGTLHGKLFNKGEYIDVCIYGITLEQYREQMYFKKTQKPDSD